MSKSEENRKHLKIKLLEAKLKTYYTRVQGLHNTASKLNLSDSNEVQSFLDSTSNLSLMRREFNSEFDELNLIKLELNPEVELDMKALLCFEEVLTAVQGRVNALSDKLNTNGPSKIPMQKMKLPPIELPKFSGDAKAWRMFIECYNSIIHYNAQLTNAERVYYLCGQLSGRALECVAGITPTGDNYSLIYETLTTKFEDVRSMGTAYLDEMLNLKKLQHASVDGLNSFIDKFSVSVAAFQRLDIPAKLDFVFLHLALKRVDGETARLFENFARHEKIPSYDSFAKFVKEQAKIIERTGVYAPSGSNYSKSPSSSYRVPVPINKSASDRSTRALVTSNQNCRLCQGDHANFYRCAEFLKLPAKERFNVVKQNGGCVLCLSFQHKPNACNIKGSCNTCQAKTHHTLLHFSRPQASTSLTVASGEEELCSEDVDDEDGGQAGVSLFSMPSSERSDSASVHSVSSTSVLLATARVRVIDSSGTAHLLRCLIDSGSQKHFISKQCCERLALTPRNLKYPMNVNGFGGGTNPVIGEAELEFFSRFDRSRPYKVRPLVVEAITQRLPTTVIDRSKFTYLKGAPLGDDTFDRPGDIDMLIGAQLFSRLLLSKRINGPPGYPDAVQTTLGFVLMGDAPVLKPGTERRTVVFCAFISPRLDEVVKRFWELEEVPSCTSALSSREDQECEQFYEATTTRDDTGRYTVALPFKSDSSDLGNSLPAAEKRFCALEKRMKASTQLREAYNEVIEEYLRNDYLAPVLNKEDAASGYIIPHHGVIRNDKVTTKLRVVMDASARTDSDISLNQILHAGPNLQGDIFRILLNFRLFPVAFCADVKQMYLQIKIAALDRKYLRILYRFDPSDELHLFEFKRLCFGLSVSPFLALRTMRQLCEDERHNFPLAVDVVKRDLYMDDIVSSERSAATATEVSVQLINLFKAGGFDLMKWSSNSEELLSQLPTTHLHPQIVKFDIDTEQKILGVKWDPRSDQFSFEMKPCKEICTKRNILSAIARLWDILGFAAPVILYAKLLIQELWSLKLDWDAVPPASVVEKWSKFQQELPLLSFITIPRNIGVSDGAKVTLVAFSDASERAYGAAVYLHSQLPTGIVVNLLCAKSRVAPLKSVTLARLELCGALLLSKLVRVVLLTYEERWKIDQVIAFTDSTVTLHWIHSSPHRWKTFVSNRVAQIQENLNPECFYHIPGKENPSDCLSRGLTPAQLQEHPLWFKGPPWISQERIYWPIQPFKPTATEMPESKPVVVLAATSSIQPLLYELAQKISSWQKLVRIVVYILRFTKKLKSRGPITVADLCDAELAIVRAVQKIYFFEAIEAIRANRPCSRYLQKLRPILVDNVLRVGGRLEQAELSFDHKHPILLPRKDHVVNMIIDDTHRKHCHTGPHLLLSILRQKFWILSGRNLIRSRVHACNTCFRVRPKSCKAPVMANLPECRLQVTKPFAHTGTDFFGPVNITLTRRRGVRSQKAYICVFICLTTRAVHVEVAPDLSTDSFLNALKRFIARRGPVQKLMSDHGTNFIGARTYLNDLHKFLNSHDYSKKWGEEMSNHRIEWQMIPPNAPHFGGGWESTVKAFKAHLLRVIGSQILTYEELLTVLCQIEAVLNSRPLGIALSPDPAEPVALTPAHFLHTTPLGSLLSAPVEDNRSHLLSRYLLLDQLVQSYWRRWSLEYLHTLQAREKWLTDTGPIKQGTVVLIMKNNTTPLQWPLGVVQETYPGGDRRTRVVLVKTTSGTFLRPVVRLCPLPSQ